MFKTIIAAILAACTAGLLMWGGSSIVHQDRVIKNAEPMQARITESQTVTRTSHSNKGRRRTSYSPQIAYQYVVGGRPYNGSAIYPARVTVSGQAQSDALVARFRVGSYVDAHYDRRNPAEAFLIKRYSFEPYFPILLGLALAGATAGAYCVASKNAPVPTARGRFQLQAGRTLAFKSNAWQLFACFFLSVGGMAFFHYFSVADRPYDTSSKVMLVIFAVAAALVLLCTGYYWKLRRSMDDAVVTIESHPVKRGEPLRMNVILPVSGGGRIDSGVFTLACVRQDRTQSGGKTQYSSRDEWTSRQEMLQGQDLTSDRLLTHDLQFLPPLGQPATSTDKSYPRYTWELRLHVKRTGPDYKAKYAIDVV